jgi:hypothetical protein
LILVALVQGTILAPLYVTIASMRLFDGALKDVNGLRPFQFNIGGKIIELDTNVVGFSNLTLLLIIASCNIVSSVPAA